jgi:hypothetical protein
MVEKRSLSTKIGIEWSNYDKWRKCGKQCIKRARNRKEESWTEVVEIAPDVVEVVAGV